METKNRKLSGQGVEIFASAVAEARQSFEDKRLERLLGMLAGAREAAVDDELIKRINQKGSRPFARRVKVPLATAASPSALVTFTTPANQPKPYKFSGSTQETKQTEDDGALFIDEIAFEFPGDLKVATLKAMRDNYGVKIYYPGGKRIRVLPLAEIMEAGAVYAIDAGVDNATSPGEAVVAGTHKIVGPARGLLRMDATEMLIVAPNESEVKLELTLMPQGTVPTLTGESADLFYFVTWRGEKVGDNHEYL